MAEAGNGHCRDVDHVLRCNDQPRIFHIADRRRMGFNAPAAWYAISYRFSNMDGNGSVRYLT